ncbi:metal ABC transporter permease [Basilea psittacipulmonis]|uniref:Zinc ABC transporter permease n=1 Tax=Basilea psittacipulmonis DSM 24701 TaxID=1072685 RepID=A0A077DCU2_9BURK|nr:metal ABC transporter permease [Basilea psittacipulmonis]AIL31996.1 hypothetical protein IX83_00455 [Basilea psittacipulmonis DSM 24701]
MYSLLIAPFVEYDFMRRALLGGLFLALSSAPLGTFLLLRRMSLVADSMSHAILPGVALGFLISGNSIVAMASGGLVAGLVVAVLAGLVTRYTNMKADASFGSFYIISLSLGVLLLSLKGSNMDLVHVLFGTILGLDNDSLMFMMIVSGLTTLVIAIIYRPLLIECFDPIFFQSEGGKGSLVHLFYLVLLVINLVAGFQVLGTLMVVGMMLLPASAASLMVKTVGKQMIAAVLIGAVSVYVGLAVSFHHTMPSSSGIMLTAGLIYILALLMGKRGVLKRR